MMFFKQLSLQGGVHFALATPTFAYVNVLVLGVQVFSYGYFFHIFISHSLKMALFFDVLLNLFGWLAITLKYNWFEAKVEHIFKFKYANGKHIIGCYLCIMSMSVIICTLILIVYQSVYFWVCCYSRKSEQNN